jgi:hypothetical protein
MSGKGKTKEKPGILVEEKGQEKLSESELKAWIEKLYGSSNISEAELKTLYDQVKYVGFDRNLVLSQMSTLTEDVNLIAQIVLVCANRGPQMASKIRLMNNKTLLEMGVSASGGKGSKKLTCQRITAATADLAASLMKRLNVNKRVEMELPGWLQFPAAGSIKLPEKFRNLHREFSRTFSALIGGEFNEQIYNQMVQNSYLNEHLRLFE